MCKRECVPGCCSSLHAFLCVPLVWTYVQWRDRYEESLLHKFYPGVYQEYAARTIIGIPFLRGYAFDQAPEAVVDERKELVAAMSELASSAYDE